MSPEKKHPMAENEVPKKVESVPDEQAAPLTKEEFAAQMAQLTERARAAGLRPLQVMAQSYARQGMTLLDKLLEGLAPDAASPKKKE